MIKERVEKIFNEIPSNVKVIAAIKTRSTHEINEAINAGIKIIGDNYIQETESRNEFLKLPVKRTFIGHLQKNKVKKAVKLFDVIETLDSVELAESINNECEKIEKIMPVMIEINIGREENKSGIFTEDLENFSKKIIQLKNLKLIGLMTMGSLGVNEKIMREEFRKMKILFDKLNLPYLSMGMSNSYKIAIEEGANIIRIGTGIFGERKN